MQTSKIKYATYSLPAEDHRLFSVQMSDLLLISRISNVALIFFLFVPYNDFVVSTDFATTKNAKTLCFARHGNAMRAIYICYTINLIT
jgi:hypothetical protein